MLSIGFALLFLTVLAVAAWFSYVPLYIPLSYGVLSLWALLLYAWDKRAAKRSGRRVPEKRLHYSSVVGGWPGAMLAQNLLRHKTVKQPFRKIFWLTVVVNICVLVVWVTPLRQQVGHLIYQLVENTINL